MGLKDCKLDTLIFPISCPTKMKENLNRIMCFSLFNSKFQVRQIWTENGEY